MQKWTDDIFAAVALIVFILAIWYGLVAISHGAHIALGSAQ